LQTAQDAWNPIQEHFQTKNPAKKSNTVAPPSAPRVNASASAFLHNQDPKQTLLA
jgi:hypothetical protein